LKPISVWNPSGSPRGLPLGFHTEISGEPPWLQICLWGASSQAHDRLVLSTPRLSGRLWAHIIHQYGKRPNRNLSHNDPATSMLQRENCNRTVEIELTYMNQTTSIMYVCRSAVNVVSLLVFLYRDMYVHMYICTKRGPESLSVERTTHLGAFFGFLELFRCFLGAYVQAHHFLYASNRR